MARFEVTKMDNSIAAQEATTAVEPQEKERVTKWLTLVEPRLKDILQWKSEGMNDYSIAEKLGIDRTTLWAYKDKYPTLSTLYTQAQDNRNCLVMNKMFERATGYEHKDLFIAQYQGSIVEKEILKHYPPDVQAADTYLRNNDPDYKGPKDVENSHIIINNFQLDDAKVKISNMLQEYNKLTALEVTDFKVVE
jgi:hypothetical protein